MAGIILKVTLFIVTLATKYSKCTVDGISYLDPVNSRRLSDIPGSDPCNPLYWYPKHIPEYCYINTTKPAPIAGPIPVPIPIPVPQPVPLPYGLPIAPSYPMMPVAGAYPQVPPGYSPYLQAPPYPQVPPYSQVPPYPHISPPISASSFGSYPYRRQQVGMVPGVPGLVSKDGGINILPFSDVYTDMLERHKNKLLRKKLRKIIKDYDDYPRMIYRSRRKYRRGIFE